MNNVASPTVWVVQTETGRKDLTDAKRFGELRVVFPRTVYNDDDVDPVAIAYKEMREYKDGDYIVVVGDPMLCGVVFDAALNYSETNVLTVLRWDRKMLKYVPYVLDFS
jgi:hypothetical protein